jgi:hypothetical protein
MAKRADAEVWIKCPECGESVEVKITAHREYDDYRSTCLVADEIVSEDWSNCEHEPITTEEFRKQVEHLIFTTRPEQLEEPDESPEPYDVHGDR